jgi:lysyl-tRNA synthetase class 2
MPSSVIRAYRYHPAERRLSIVFTNGRRYIYLDVPADLVEAFAAAESKGEFFNARIRDHFTFDRIR